jgi:hypothetical protein
MWYQSELLLQDRKEHIERQITEARMDRIAAGRPHAPAKPRRFRFLSRR